MLSISASTRLLVGIAAIALRTSAQLTDGTLTCDANTTPDWDDCEVIFSSLSPFFDYSIPVNQCQTRTYGNCKTSMCTDRTRDNDVTSRYEYNGYQYITGRCRGAESGGKFVFTSEGDTPAAGLTYYVEFDPFFEPSSARVSSGATVNTTQTSSVSRRHPRDLFRKAEGNCVDGNGELRIIATYLNTVRPGETYAVTGRLPAGSQYIIQSTDTRSFSVGASLSVEAGFFDLFSVTASVSVTSEFSESTTEGVQVNVDCEPGQDGIIYVEGTYDRYEAACVSDGGTPIDVYVPVSPQNSYFVTCLN